MHLEAETLRTESWHKSRGNRHRMGEYGECAPNRVKGSFSLPLPTTPHMRNRKGRFDLLPGRSRVVHVHPQVLDSNEPLFLHPVMCHATLRRGGL